jgi:hypothetical protein
MSEGEAIVDVVDVVDEDSGLVQTGDDENASSVLPAIIDVQRRLRRFASVRSAQRALTPSVAQLREDSAQTRGQQLRHQLEGLAAQWKALNATDTPDPDEIEALCSGFDQVDIELTEISDELRLYADGVHAVQLRSTLPEIAHRHRREVCGFLDLLIEDTEGLERRRATIEYVVTLLATSDESGTRKIAHDPAKLTPAMQSLCERTESECGAVSEEYELAFFEAANVDDSADVFARVRELRAKKEELGAACFLPGVLRALVTYNVRMANQMSSAVMTSRAEDLAFEDLVEETESKKLESKEEEEEQPQEEEESELDFVEPELKVESIEPISIHDSSGISQIWEALRRRLRSVPIGSCVSERVALAVDLTPLDVDELRMLGSEESDEEQTTAAILLVGLLNSVYPAIEASLVELGITREQLHEDWAQELDQDLQERISALLASNEYESACRLSEFKTKHLYASLSSLARVRRDRDGIRPQRLRTEEDAARTDMLAAAREAEAELRGSIGKNWVAPVRRVALGEDGMARKIRGGIVAAVACTMVIIAAVNWIRAEAPEIAELRPRQLSDISLYLKTAYRNGNGSGALVIGRVDEHWHALSKEMQIEAATEMRLQFLNEEVKDAMIYDADYRLQIHLASGEIRQPVPDRAR